MSIVDPAVQQAVEEIFRQVLSNDNLVFSEELNGRSLKGWNSLNHMRIIVEIEKKFSVRFKPKEVVALNNFGDLLRLLNSKISEASK